MEELAQKLNLPVDATVRRRGGATTSSPTRAGTRTYNKEPYRLLKLDHPPYYGVRTSSWFLATIDGCPVNTDMHPVNEAGEQIDGLYGGARLGRLLQRELSQPVHGA